MGNIEFVKVGGSKFHAEVDGELFIIEAGMECEGERHRWRAEYVVSDSGDPDGIERVSRAFDDAHGWE